MDSRRAFAFHGPRTIAVGLILAAAGSTYQPAQATESVRPPTCAEMDRWAAKFDRDDEWQPSPIGNRHRFARLFAQEEITQQFGKPMVSWTEADVKAVRDAALACRRETRDRDLSTRYNQIQSALASRLANFARDTASARERARAAMTALEAMPPSAGLLRLQLALADAGSPAGYQKLQRAATTLPPQAMQAAAPARELAAAMVHLTEEDIAGIVTTPAAASAAGMRKGVLDGMVADLGGIPADPGGLQAIQQARLTVARDYADVFATADREQLDKAIAARQPAIGEEITVAVITQIGQSSTVLDNAFADIEARSSPQLASLLAPAQAARIREAAEARRNAVAEPLYKDFTADLAKLPMDEASLDRIDEAGDAIGNWPSVAADQAPRFRKAAEDRRAAVLAAVNRKDSGRMSGRVYHSPNGREKLEFVDRSRVLVSSGEHTMPASYVEEKDGRISITAPDMAVTVTREGRRLRGWTTPLARVK